tara:strand:+ start:145 stop:435 length:291 start_codon:yes stop_codon:yes gene_type:complete
MNIKYYFFATLTWCFSVLSLVTLYTGYPDPVMIICAVIFFLGATGFGLMAKASMLPKPTITEYKSFDEYIKAQGEEEFIWNTPAYQRRGLGHDEQH